MRLEQRDGDVRNKPFHSIRPHEAIHDAKKISTVLYPINHPKNFQNSSSSTSKSLKSSLGTYSPHPLFLQSGFHYYGFIRFVWTFRGQRMSGGKLLCIIIEHAKQACKRSHLNALRLKDWLRTFGNLCCSAALVMKYREIWKLKRTYHDSFKNWLSRPLIEKFWELDWQNESDLYNGWRWVNYEVVSRNLKSINAEK